MLYDGVTLTSQETEQQRMSFGRSTNQGSHPFEVLMQEMGRAPTGTRSPAPQFFNASTYGTSKSSNNGPALTGAHQEYGLPPPPGFQYPPRQFPMRFAGPDLGPSAHKLSGMSPILNNFSLAGLQPALGPKTRCEQPTVVSTSLATKKLVNAFRPKQDKTIIKQKLNSLLQEQEEDREEMNATISESEAPSDANASISDCELVLSDARQSESGAAAQMSAIGTSILRCSANQT